MTEPKKIVFQNENMAQFKCGTCDKSFDRKNKLHIHMAAVHEKLKLFKCNLCEYSFTQKGGLDHHERRVHQKGNFFSCLECEKQYVQKSMLDAHVSAIHLQLKFSCGLCDKKFAYDKDMRYHENHSHNEIVTYTCSKCDKSFRSMLTLKRHDRDSKCNKSESLYLQRKLNKSRADAEKHSVANEKLKSLVDILTEDKRILNLKVSQHEKTIDKINSDNWKLELRLKKLSGCNDSKVDEVNNLTHIIRTHQKNARISNHNENEHFKTLARLKDDRSDFAEKCQQRSEAHVLVSERMQERFNGNYEKLLQQIPRVIEGSLCGLCQFEITPGTKECYVKACVPCAAKTEFCRKQIPGPDIVEEKIVNSVPLVKHIIKKSLPVKIQKSNINHSKFMNTYKPVNQVDVNLKLLKLHGINKEMSVRILKMNNSVFKHYMKKTINHSVPKKIFNSHSIPTQVINID